MKYQSLPASFFNENRRKLIEQLPDNSLVILFSSEEYPRNGDQFFPFRQNSDLYYLTGIDQEETALLIHKTAILNEGKCLLFIKKTDKNQQIWNGFKLTPNQAAKLSGIQDVLYIDDVYSVLDSYAPLSENIFSWCPNMAKFDANALRGSRNLEVAARETLSRLRHFNLFDITSRLRLLKSGEEIEVMKKAISITKTAYNSVLSSLKPNKFEYEIEAIITYHFLKQGATGHAYSPIVAGGANACILHYTDNDKKLNDGDLLLIDFGAEYGNYAADCTRTIPVNGKFSSRQRACYQAVLDVYKKAIALFVPGNTIEEINIQTGFWLQEKMIELGLFSQSDVDNHQDETPLFFKYFMHGTSHFIGLDVHDVGTKQTVFQEGMVLTCEPGLYIDEEDIGIRIETNVMVANPPIDLMADFPVEIDEIENAMRF